MKRLLTIATTALLALALTACGGATLTRPDQAVFATKGAYEGALTGMVAYARLPRCAAATTPVCSRQDILDQIERARSAARLAIDAAEGAVRTPGFGQDATQSALVAAEAAARALTGILATLPKRAP